MCTCVGPPDAIAMGSPTVMINNLMAARMGDPTVHGGIITLGCPTVQIGGAVVTLSPAAIAATAKTLETAALKKIADDAAKAAALAAGLPPPP